MKKTIITTGFITAIISVALAVTPLFKISIIPTLIAITCGVVALYLSLKEKSKPKSIQYILVIAVLSLSVFIYKIVVDKNEIGNIEELNKREQDNLNESKEILDDIEIDEEF